MSILNPVVWNRASLSVNCWSLCKIICCFSKLVCYSSRDLNLLSFVRSQWLVVPCPGLGTLAPSPCQTLALLPFCSDYKLRCKTGVGLANKTSCQLLAFTLNPKEPKGSFLWLLKSLFINYLFLNSEKQNHLKEMLRGRSPLHTFTLITVDLSEIKHDG